MGPAAHTIDSGGDKAHHGDSRAHHQGKRKKLHVSSVGQSQSTEASESLRAEQLSLEYFTLQTAVLSHLVVVLHVGHLLHEVLVGFLEPLEVASVHVHRELFVLPDGSMAHLVHLVELALEQNEVTAGLRLAVHHALFELLEGVDDLEEVSVVKEEIEVLDLGLLDDGLNWDEQSVLVEVGFELRVAVSLQSARGAG